MNSFEFAGALFVILILLGCWILLCIVHPTLGFGTIAFLILWGIVELLMRKGYIK